MPKRQLTNLALCLAVVPLLGWWLTGLFDIDEGFYAAVVAEMNRRGEWITPYYNGSPWFEKPILAYWLAKPTVALFGEMVGPRLPSVLCTIGTYLLVAWYLRRRVSETAATWTVLALGSSLLFVAVGRMTMTDMPLVLAFSAAMLAFWESLVGDRRWRILTAGLLGVGVLAKGPVALILFVPIVAWTFWREKELRPAFRGHWLTGTLVLALVIATWYIPVYLANGQLFVQKFLIEQNIGRFTGGDAAHSIKGAWTIILYVPVVFIGMLPWSVWIWKAWPRNPLPPQRLGRKGQGMEGFELVDGATLDEAANLHPPTPSSKTNHLEEAAFLRYLATWATVVFVFFSISSAKLPHYVLPVLVPLAMLIGSYLAKRKPLETIRQMAFPIVWMLFMSILANVSFLWWYQQSGQAEAHTFARYIRTNSIHKVERTVAVFQIPKKEGRKAAGTLKLQETSLPSMLLYLDSTVNEADTAQEVVEKNSHWLFTRKGRITDEVRDDFARLGRKLNPIGPEGQNFELYEVVSAAIPANSL